MNVTDLGTVFGLDVKASRTELHVFKGSVEFQTTAGAKPESVFPYPNPFSSRAYSGLSRVNT